MLSEVFLAALIWSDAVKSFCPPPKNVAIVGLARDIESDNVLYCEFHYLDWSAESAKVQYVDAQGDVFATKKVDYTHGLERPAIDQFDSRWNEKRIVDIAEKKFTLKFQKSDKSGLKRKAYAVDQVDIIDAGFDHFVRANWDDLQRSSATVRFASVPHLKVLKLRVSSQPMKNCPKVGGSDNFYCFWVDIGNPFVRFFTGRLRLVYSQDRMLQVFEGVVNINRAVGQSQKARIQYEYDLRQLGKGGSTSENAANFLD